MLFVYNYPTCLCSVSGKVEPIETVYFPPNMTSKIQAIDQEIISHLKIYSHKRILVKIVKATDLSTYTHKTVSVT